MYNSDSLIAKLVMPMLNVRILYNMIIITNHVTEWIRYMKARLIVYTPSFHTNQLLSFRKHVGASWAAAPSENMWKSMVSASREYPDTLWTCCWAVDGKLTSVWKHLESSSTLYRVSKWSYPPKKKIISPKCIHYCLGAQILNTPQRNHSLICL